MIEQQQNLGRVSKRLGRSIMTFCRAAFSSREGLFRMEQLVEYVRLSAGIVAPDSPSRILRQLRAQGRLDYVVVNRAASLYQLTSVQGAPS